MKKAYLDWICVIKSYRHKGIAQALMHELRVKLKEKELDDSTCAFFAQVQKKGNREVKRKKW